MASRSIADLETTTRAKAEKFISLADAVPKFDYLIYCTLRTNEEQAILYRQSRPLSEIKAKAKELSDTWGRADLAKILMDAGPQYGPHVTNAAPGQSLHNYGMAFDAVPMRNGKPVWGTSDADDKRLWTIYGELAEMAGLEWAGNWSTFREFPHCQQTADWRELIGRGI